MLVYSTHTSQPTAHSFFPLPFLPSPKLGDTHGNPFWNIIRDLLIHDPSDEQVKCHAPKPILLDTGELNFPYPWQPTIVPLQLLRVGQLVAIAVPGEFTTMAGRWLRGNVSQVRGEEEREGEREGERKRESERERERRGRGGKR